jgi:hypothetical protein
MALAFGGGGTHDKKMNTYPESYITKYTTFTKMKSLRTWELCWVREEERFPVLWLHLPQAYRI